MLNFISFYWFFPCLFSGHILCLLNQSVIKKWFYIMKSPSGFHTSNPYYWFHATECSQVFILMIDMLLSCDPSTIRSKYTLKSLCLIQLIAICKSLIVIKECFCICPLPPSNEFRCNQFLLKMKDTDSFQNFNASSLLKTIIIIVSINFSLWLFSPLESDRLSNSIATDTLSNSIIVRTFYIRQLQEVEHF